MNQYLKFGAQVAVTVLAAVMAALVDGAITASEWVNVAILGLGAVAVLGAGELPGTVWERAKTYVSAATAGAVVLQSVITGGVTPVEWMQIALAVFGALGVHVVPGPQLAACAPEAQPEPAPAPSRRDPLVEQWDADFTAWKNRQDHGDDTQEIPAVSDPHGIHAHPTKKLGKRPPILGRAAVPFGRFLAAVPDHPLVDAPPSLSYPMDHNDVAGDCVVAGLDHTLQTICAALGVPRQNWTDAELLAFYRTQNPGFRSWADGGGSNDRGMVIQTFLEYLAAQKVILAFGKIDHTNEDEMKAAAYLGLAIVTGEELQTAQQNQTVWDYKRSGDWGGHCTCTVGYQASPDQQTVVTWGQEVQVTQAFITHQLDEAWFVLTQAHVDHPGFRDHFDLAGFAAAVAELTGGKVVVPVPAPQPPAPVPPAPAPGPVPIPAALAADLTAWAHRAIGRRDDSHADKKTAQEWLDWEATQ